MVVAALSVGGVWRTPSRDAADFAALQCMTATRAVEADVYGRDAGLRPELRQWAMPGPLTPVQQTEVNRRVSDVCARANLPPPGTAQVLAVAILLSLGVLIYWTLPTWRIRRHRLVPLARAERADVEEEVERLVQAAGVQVTVLINPTDYRAEGTAFGRAGKRYVELKSGMLRLCTEDPAAFRAVFDHELGHIGNRDLDITYLTVGLWRAYTFLSVVILLFYRTHLGLTGQEQVANGIHLAVLWLVVYLARNGILRVREYYADAFAARHDASRDALVRLLGQHTRSHAIWPSLGGMHPPPHRRIAVLQDLRRIADLGRGDALAIGFTALLTLQIILGMQTGTPVQYWLLRLGFIGWDSVTARPSYPLLTLLVLVPAGAALSVGVWRTVLTTRTRLLPRRLTVLALALAAGLLLGSMAAPPDSGLSMPEDPLALSIPGLGTSATAQHLGLVAVAASIILVLGLAALAWRPFTSRRNVPTWYFPGFGALLLTTWPAASIGHATLPAIVAVLIGFTALGVILSARLRHRDDPTRSDPWRSTLPPAAPGPDASTVPADTNLDDEPQSITVSPRWWRLGVTIVAIGFAGSSAVIAGALTIAELTSNEPLPVLTVAFAFALSYFVVVMTRSVFASSSARSHHLRSNAIQALCVAVGAITAGTAIVSGGQPTAIAVPFGVLATGGLAVHTTAERAAASWRRRMCRRRQSTAAPTSATVTAAADNASVAARSSSTASRSA